MSTFLMAYQEVMSYEEDVVKKDRGIRVYMATLYCKRDIKRMVKELLRIIGDKKEEILGYQLYIKSQKEVVLLLYYGDDVEKVIGISNDILLKGYEKGWMFDLSELYDLNKDNEKAIFLNNIGDKDRVNRYKKVLSFNPVGKCIWHGERIYTQ